MTASNTAGNTANPGAFKKGDPRINRKGRPVNFDALRELALQIAHEEALSKGKDGAPGAPIVIGGHKVTVAEIVLREWFMSKDFQKQKAALEIAYGKVPENIRLSGPDGDAIRIILDE
jgi:hypothetical protein